MLCSPFIPKIHKQELRHSGEGRNPVFLAELDHWIPACAGMTIEKRQF